MIISGSRYKRKSRSYKTGSSGERRSERRGGQEERLRGGKREAKTRSTGESERQRELRKMKKEGEKWVEWEAREERIGRQAQEGGYRGLAYKEKEAYRLLYRQMF
jgi:hypothetical protein